MYINCFTVILSGSQRAKILACGHPAVLIQKSQRGFILCSHSRSLNSGSLGHSAQKGSQTISGLPDRVQEGKEIILMQCGALPVGVTIRIKLEYTLYISVQDVCKRKGGGRIE